MTIKTLAAVVGTLAEAWRNDDDPVTVYLWLTNKVQVR
jgi:hypothetical protein